MAEPAPTEDTDPLDALAELLAREAVALRSGALADLAALAERKTALAEALAARPPTDDPRLPGMRRMAEESQRRLEAAAGGVRAAIRRLEESRRVAGHLDTYTARGARADLAVPAPTVERRA